MKLREVNQLAQGHTAWEKVVRLTKVCYLICENTGEMSRFKQSYNVASSGKWNRSGGEENTEVVSSGRVNPRRLPGGSSSEVNGTVDLGY